MPIYQYNTTSTVPVENTIQAKRMKGGQRTSNGSTTQLLGVRVILGFSVMVFEICLMDGETLSLNLILGLRM